MVISSLLNVSDLTPEVEVRSKFQHVSVLIIEANLLIFKDIATQKRGHSTQKKVSIQ